MIFETCVEKDLLFEKHRHVKVEAFIDVNWAGLINDR